MTNFEKTYKQSVEILTKYITDNKIIPTEKEWNKVAAQNNYLTSPTMGFISGIKFPDLCKKIYKKMLKKEK